MQYPSKLDRSVLGLLRDGPFDFQGGLGFFEKNSLFPNRSEKNKMSSMKLKIKSLFFIWLSFSKPFSL